MIYVRVEDSTDGFKLCKDICDIYFKQAYNIESLNGIIDVGSKIEELLDSTNN